MLGRILRFLFGHFDGCEGCGGKVKTIVWNNGRWMGLCEDCLRLFFVCKAGMITRAK